MSVTTGWPIEFVRQRSNIFVFKEEKEIRDHIWPKLRPAKFRKKRRVLNRLECRPLEGFCWFLVLSIDLAQCPLLLFILGVGAM